MNNKNEQQILKKFFSFFKMIRLTVKTLTNSLKRIEGTKINEQQIFRKICCPSSNYFD